MNLTSAFDDRIITAMEHPATTMLAHPTGRRLLERSGYPVDVDAVLEAAAQLGVVIELNAQPQRLDLDWRSLRKAGELGVYVAIGSNAHKIADLDHLPTAIGIARKAWLEASQVLNTWETSAVQQLFHQRSL